MIKSTVNLSSNNSPQKRLNRPKSITLNFDQPSPRNMFMNALPPKKFSELSKYQQKKYRSTSNSLYKPRKQNKVRKNSECLPVEVGAIKDLIDKKIINNGGSGKKEERCQTAMSQTNFKPLIKRKISRTSHTQRTLTAPSSDTTSQQIQPVKKLTCLIFGSLLPTESNEVEKEIEIAKAPHLSFHTSSGKKQKADSYMYMRKVKAKGEHRVLSQIHGESFQNRPNSSTQRQLFIRKENQTKKRSYLSSYINLIKKPVRKVKPLLKKEQKHEYSPWSAENSDNQD